MSLYSILLGIQYISILLTLFLCAYITRKWSKPAHGWLFFYCISTLVNNAGYLALMHAETQREAVLIWQFTYITRAWIPFTVLKFCLYLCTGKSYSKITSVLAGFHVLMYFLVLDMGNNNLFYSSYTFVKDGIYLHFAYTYGIFHYIFDGLCLIYIFVVMKVLMLSIKNANEKHKRRQFITVTCAVFVVIVFYLGKLIDVVPGYDETSLGFTLGALFFYVAIFVFGMLDTRDFSDAVVITEKTENNSDNDNSVKIEAFGDFDTKIKLPLKEILYFEADAERVFAYTTEEIYNVKLRLYQVEELSQSSGIIRVSKSHLINVQKIESVRPALNSRLYVKMLNGEEVLVSRKYAHILKAAIA